MQNPRPIQSFSDVIECWASSSELGRELGVSDIVVRAWKRRGIPGEHWAAVVKAASGRPFADEVTLELLASLGAEIAQSRKRGSSSPDGEADDEKDCIAGLGRTPEEAFSKPEAAE